MNIPWKFRDSLNEFKGFQVTLDHITLKVLLNKHKENADITFAPVCFNSTTKAEISPIDNLDRSFWEVFNRIVNWVSEGSGWVTESINGEYTNASV